MYEAFYGLNSRPFQLNPDPAYYYVSKEHRRAKAYLEYGVTRGEGFIVVTGEVGAGKTTTIRGLLDQLDATQLVVGQIVTSQLDAEDTLRMVCAAFGVQARSVSKSDLLTSLEGFLVSQAMRGRRCLLIVDEAQNLTLRALEELRMLSNFQYGKQSLLQTFLVGQPEFRETLQRPEVEQFRQRVIAACHIGPLELAETHQYVLHRLKHAGAQAGKPGFDAGVLDAIHEAAHGIPRRINVLCDRLLLLGFMTARTQLTLDDVKVVVADMAREVEAPASTARKQLNGHNGHAREASFPAGDRVAEPSLGDVRIDPQTAADALAGLTRAEAEQFSERLQRMERSLLRLERTQLQILATLKEFTRAARDAAASPSPPAPQHEKKP